MGDETTRLKRSPPKAKRLSYERDCVNTYGENDKSSRKAIRRFNAASNRNARRSAKIAVASYDTDDEEKAAIALAEAGHLARRPEETKVPDQPLGITLGKIHDGKRKRKLTRDAFPYLSKRFP